MAATVFGILLIKHLLPASPTDAADPMAGGTFTAGSKIRTFKVTGTADAFANSTVGASDIGAVSLTSVKGDNGGTKFGVVGHASIQGVTVTTQAFTFNKTAATPQGFGDLQVTMTQ
ncbi:MAG: hypothetical protein SGI86_17740 [Deltaproteobacteria bacterium]|nr:hypothetical protein [Deltaproteobacteria bacterium]